MMWLDLSILLVAAIASFFGTSFLSSAWKKKKKGDPETLRIGANLPGYDCGLCGRRDCRSYAEAIILEAADLGLCSPGGGRQESRLRSYFSERQGDVRGNAMRAVVRCGGCEGIAASDFPFDGRNSCRSAVEMYGGPKRCKDGCVGLGSCAKACPRGAIRVMAGLAIVNPALCTGCGECVKSCPTGVISLLPRDQAWYVACSSKRSPEFKAAQCSAACTGCGECAMMSLRSEFKQKGSLAREDTDVRGGRWSDIAEHCPTGAIVLVGSEKKRRSPFRKNER
jgi:Na+-translocating ferredoxin:NAD+ oxidoreductase subunit B